MCMNSAESLAVVERFRKAFNAHDWEGLVHVLAEDILWDAPISPGRFEAERRPSNDLRNSSPRFPT